MSRSHFKVTIIGAGPAGLYAGILIKLARPDADIRIIEQNAPDATFGFGVVFSDDALSFLRMDDPATADLIEPHMKHWQDIAVVHGGERIAIDGIGFSGIERLKLLQLLQNRAQSLGIEPDYNTRITSLADLQDSNLIIGADGLNSIIRNSAKASFGESLAHLNNRFIWYGADREFDALTQTFIETPYGQMNAHHYAYAPGTATFIIEMTPETFERTGFAQMEEPVYRARCEDLFADTLKGARLIPNNSIWRQFPVLSCANWFSENKVLVGDALHTAHFSIGSGTRLALEDVIALVKALREHDWSVETALPAYQATRQPILEKITGAAARSAAWYEKFDTYMALDPWSFALSYIYRAGRLTSERLRHLSPKFARSLEQRGIDLDATA